MDQPGKAAVCFLSCVLLGCTAGGRESHTGGTDGWGGRVRVYGSLRAILHEGRTGAAVTLDELLPDPRIYALGALAGLAGEITVIRGRAYLSYPLGLQRTRTVVTSRTEVAAALLVAARVSAWREVVTTRRIPFEALGDEIERLAASAGIGRNQRFPFLLEGTFEELSWHVIDGRRLAAEKASSQADHHAASIRARRERAPAVLLGFYSASDQGVFTHRDSRFHLHCALQEPRAAGHVDHVVVPPGTTVKFPRRSRGRRR